MFLPIGGVPIETFSTPLRSAQLCGSACLRK